MEHQRQVAEDTVAQHATTKADYDHVHSMRGTAQEAHEEMQAITDARDPLPPLMAQWVAVPGDVAQGSHSYEAVLMETVDVAHAMLIREAAKEGKRLRAPVMCRVVVEAWVEDDS